MGYFVAITLVIMAGLMYRTSSRVVFENAKRRDRRVLIALPVAVLAIAWLVCAAWWSAGH